jgi:hypothetical protein
MLDKKEESAGLFGLSKVISAASVTEKPEGQKAGK